MDTRLNPRAVLLIMPQSLTVRGMACDGCETAVREALEDLDGVTGVEVDRDGDRVTVEGEATSESLTQAVEEAGYEASV